MIRMRQGKSGLTSPRSLATSQGGVSVEAPSVTQAGTEAKGRRYEFPRTAFFRVRSFSMCVPPADPVSR